MQTRSCSRSSADKVMMVGAAGDMFEVDCKMVWRWQSTREYKRVKQDGSVQEEMLNEIGL